MKQSSSTIPIFVIVILVLCCCLIALLSGAFIVLYRFGRSIAQIPVDPPFQTYNPTPTTFEITRQPVDEIPTETLELLERTTIPDNDLAALACRFDQLCDISPTVNPPAGPYSVGDHLTFWVNNSDDNDYRQVDTTLHYATPHAYFWVKDGTRVDDGEVADLLDAFENTIYPTDRQFFGSEWFPGVDGDPHIYIVYTDGLGSNVAGYFYSPDEYNPIVRQYSNAHETFYISSSEALSSDYTYGTLAHEFQHMIHWYQDRNESAFLNEGFSELATYLNGYDTGGFDWLYLNNPDLNLTDWLGSAGDNGAHYGASFIFLAYFLDRFGEEATQALVHDQQNGLNSIDDVLTQLGITDPQTGQPIGADDFFLDWATTNYIQDGSVGDGRYTYHDYSQAPQAHDTEQIGACPLAGSTRTVNQYGVDYIRITCPGNHTLHFDGATSVRLLPEDPYSGTYALWSNKGDESDMTLTHDFDFTGVSGPIDMTYWTWYDIEEDYDYVYVEASNGDQPVQILITPSGTAFNPTGSSYGWAYTGSSGGWIQETVDLSQFAGQTVTIRFEYITDPAVNGEGLLLDDVAIPAIDYSADFEADDGGWQADGFARIRNSVPQTFRLALISHLDSGTTVQVIPVGPDQSVDIPLSIGQGGLQDAVLVVTGTTRFTRSLAAYQIEIR